jgi:hypothetical protein
VISVSELADQLSVDPGDIRVLLAQMGEHAVPTTDELAAQIRDQLNPFGERTVDGLYWPHSDPDTDRDATTMR